jgi:DNA-directed RNA polymerase subunit RPC12/RpoP
MFQYITAHCGKLVNINSEEELNYEKLRCPHCNQLINN